MNDLWVYPLSSNSLVSVCIISQHNLGHILAGKRYPSSFLDIAILKEFTNCVFQALQIDQHSEGLLIGVMRDGELMWDLMKTSPKDCLIREDMCPCIVWCEFEKRLFRIEYTFPTSPHMFVVDNPNRKRLRLDEPFSEQTQYTLSQSLHETFGITPRIEEGILVSHTGPAIPSPLVLDHSKMRTNTCKTYPVKYLVRELVLFHPLTFVQHDISDLVRFLRWIDFGFLSQKILDMYHIPHSILFAQLSYSFIPAGFRAFHAPIVTLMHVALTCPKAQLTYSNEKLEWLGDAVWRFLAAFSGIQEPAIRAHFSVILSNNRMGKMAIKHSSFLASSYESNLIPNVVEAILGVAFISGGLSQANSVAHSLGLYDLNELPKNATSNRTVSFINGAVATAFGSLKVSLQIINELPYQKLGQWTETRSMQIKMHVNEIAATPILLTDWQNLLPVDL